MQVLLRLSCCCAAAAAEVITHYSICWLNALIAFVFPIKNQQVTRNAIYNKQEEGSTQEVSGVGSRGGRGQGFRESAFGV